MSGLYPVGITGALSTKSGELLGVNLILAKKSDFVVDNARLCMTEYGLYI